MERIAAQISRKRAARTVAKHSRIQAVTKRLIDLVLATTGFVALSPLLLLIGLAIALDSGFPILYRCQRIGRYGRPFTVLKFRTMRDGSHHHLEEMLTADEELRLEYHVSRKLREDPRRTRVGAFLRRTSLDELPQLLNVMTGTMSLVGPRPYFPGELDGRPEAAQILRIRPGITGLWQVSGRSDRTFEERLALDVDYVQRRALGLDLKIMGRTVGAVVSGRGAY